MKKKSKSSFLNFLFLILVWIVISSNGSRLFAQSQDCDCKENFDSVSNHIEKNYPYFLLHSVIEESYLSHKQSFKNRSSQINQAKPCFSLLQQYLNWFGDGHLGVSYSGDVFKPKKVKAQKTPRWENLTEERAKRYCDSIGPLDPFIGIWESYESFYKVLLCKNGKGYSAFLISSD
jgi:hypothetical protein